MLVGIVRKEGDYDEVELNKKISVEFVLCCLWFF